MNKELIEALEQCQKAFDNLCGNSMMYKPLMVNIKKALQKAKEEEKPKSRKDIVCDAIREGKSANEISKIRDIEYDKENRIESINSRIQTEIAKHGKDDNLLHAINIASNKIYSESVKPILYELDKQYQLKDKYINCIEDLSDEITQMHKDQQPTKNAEEFLESKGITSLERVWERYLSTGKTLADLLEEFANERKDEIQQRDLTIQELSEQLIESNQSKWISVEEQIKLLKSFQSIQSKDGDFDDLRSISEKDLEKFIEVYHNHQ